VIRLASFGADSAPARKPTEVLKSQQQRQTLFVSCCWRVFFWSVNHCLLVLSRDDSAVASTFPWIAFLGIRWPFVPSNSDARLLYLFALMAATSAVFLALAGLLVPSRGDSAVPVIYPWIAAREIRWPFALSNTDNPLLSHFVAVAALASAVLALAVSSALLVLEVAALLALAVSSDLLVLEVAALLVLAAASAGA